MSEFGDKLIESAKQMDNMIYAAIIDLAKQAFEDHFEADSNDPSVRQELDVWLASWRRSTKVWDEELVDLATKLQYLVDFLDSRGMLPDRCFTFPDGYTWYSSSCGKQERDT